MTPLRAILLGLALAASAGCSDRKVLLSEHSEFVVTDLKTGSGVPAKLGDEITAEYTLALPDGTILVDITGYKSHTWTLGDETVIAGVEEAIIGMRPGGVRNVVLPPDMHYGEEGYADGVVPPNTTLTMRVMLVAVR